MHGCAGIDTGIGELARAWAPPPDLTVSQWADQYRQLSRESAAAPGQWRTDWAPYQREPMDVLSDHRVREVVLMTSSQVGKTSVLENVLGYHIDLDPGPMLIIMPNLDLAKTFSKDRLAPMIRDTPALRGKVADVRSRDSDNTLLHKRIIGGGHITLAGSNSASGLVSRPIRIALCDEVDIYEASAGTEGDAVELTRRRLDAFWNSKLILASTPTVRGASRIELAYQQSDRRKYWLPCPHCGTEQLLEWRNVRWPEGRPREARLFCESCGAAWSDGLRVRALALGQWRAEAPFDGVAGFWLNALYSPWCRVADLAVEHQKAYGNRELMKVFWNTRLAETWAEAGEGIEPNAIAQRAERYEAEVPEGGLVLTAGCDVQKDRLEIEVLAGGENEETWGVRYFVLRGDTSRPEVWQRLAEEVLGATFLAEDGQPLRISAMCVDENYATTMVRRFVRRFPGRAFAIVGRAGAGRPIISAPKKAKSGRERIGLKVFTVGVDEVKTLLYGRLEIAEPGPGYCHFPIGAGYDSEYFQQLTAEQVVIKAYRGVNRREWIKIRARNEALDARVYALAALALLNPRYEALRRRRAKKADKATPRQPGGQAEPAQAERAADKIRRITRARANWVNRWRR